jgi:hypothetical protein
LEEAPGRGDGLSLVSWRRRFDEPIKLPGGGRLFTLKDAIAWLAKEIPQSEHRMKEVQTAARCVTEAAENGGPMQFARIGMMQAINRHHQHRTEPRWKASKALRDREITKGIKCYD